MVRRVIGRLMEWVRRRVWGVGVVRDWLDDYQMLLCLATSKSGEPITLQEYRRMLEGKV